MEILAEEIFRIKEAWETNRQTAKIYGLIKYQSKQLVIHRNRKKRAISNGYVPLLKGRLRKDCRVVTKGNNELVKLRMGNELLRLNICNSTILSASTWKTALLPMKSGAKPRRDILR